MGTKIQTNLEANETSKITFKILPSQQLLKQSQSRASSNILVKESCMLKIPS